jgi:ubiquinone/menaquinone biosynthesis C-methylase UbiE
MRELWSEKLTAYTFQYQRLVKPYKDLLAVTEKAIDKRPGMKVLDMGCGSGRIIEMLVERHEPQSIDAFDLSPFALQHARKHVDRLGSPCPVNYHVRDLSHPECLWGWDNSQFDLVTAGLSLHYAQHWDANQQRWTTLGYQRILKDIFRVMAPGGQFVFSVDTPNPRFFRLAVESRREIFGTWWKAPYLLAISGLLLLQGREIAKQAAIGRYCYLPIEETVSYLQAAGFTDIRHELTFADMAWLISCRKPASLPC